MAGLPQACQQRASALRPASEPALHRERFEYADGMSELILEVVQEADGGYCAECLTGNIFTGGDEL